MSFRAVVDGLNETGYAGATIAISGLARDGTYECEVPNSDPPAFIPCDNCESGAASFSIDPTAIDYDTTADYFAIRAHMIGPNLRGTSAGCWTEALGWTPGAPICGPGSTRPIYEGTISQGDWLTFGGAPVYPGFLAEWPTYPDDRNFVKVNWPDFRFPAAWMVNPDPVWPIPDSEGNTFGQCLFTLPQIPTAPFTVDLTHFNHDAGQGTWSLSIREYRIGETETPPIRQSRIIGAA